LRQKTPPSSKAHQKSSSKKLAAPSTSQTYFTIKEAIRANLIVGVLALLIFFPLSYFAQFEIMGSDYYFHATLTFFCFTVLPVLYLVINQLVRMRKIQTFFIGTPSGLSKKNILKSLLQGLGMHAGIFYPWITLANKNVSGVISLNFWYFHLSSPAAWFRELLFISLNIIMFEYYSKAFVQLQFMRAKGSLIFGKGKYYLHIGNGGAFLLQFAVWMGGHWLEFTWLPDIIGPANAIAFITISGLLTGVTVYDTENILGVTVGHILLNVLIMLTFTQ